MRRVVDHMLKSLKADLGHPIILNSDGTVMDGVGDIAARAVRLIGAMRFVPWTSGVGSS